MPPSSAKSKNVIQYQLTGHEIVNQWFRTRMLRGRTLIIYGAMMVIGLGVVISNHRLLTGWALLACPFVFALIFRSALTRMVKKNPAMTAPRTFSFDAEGVVFASGKARNEYDWSEVQRFSESGDYYLLAVGPGGSVADIPKTAFTEEEREAFLSYARSLSAK